MKIRSTVIPFRQVSCYSQNNSCVSLNNDHWIIVWIHKTGMWEFGQSLHNCGCKSHTWCLLSVCLTMENILVDWRGSFFWQKSSWEKMSLTQFSFLCKSGILKWVHQDRFSLESQLKPVVLVDVSVLKSYLFIRNIRRKSNPSLITVPCLNKCWFHLCLCSTKRTRDNNVQSGSFLDCSNLRIQRKTGLKNYFLELYKLILFNWFAILNQGN